MKDMIIVGCQGAIGNHLTQAFASKYIVHGTYHEKLIYSSRSYGRIHRLNVLSLKWCEEFVETIKKKVFGPLILINAFGASADSMAHKASPEGWQATLGVNLDGVFNMCRAILPTMRNDGWGRIINLSSVVGHIGVPGTAAYAASKAGLEGLTRTLAVENGPRGITVNSLVLGYMSIGLIGSVPEEDKRMLVQRIPTRCLGHPDNVVNAVQFLIDSDYVNGASIPIDGGFLCT